MSAFFSDGGNPLLESPTVEVRLMFHSFRSGISINAGRPLGTMERSKGRPGGRSGTRLRSGSCLAPSRGRAPSCRSRSWRAAPRTGRTAIKKFVIKKSKPSTLSRNDMS